MFSYAWPLIEIIQKKTECLSPWSFSTKYKQLLCLRWRTPWQYKRADKHSKGCSVTTLIALSHCTNSNLNNIYYKYLVIKVNIYLLYLCINEWEVLSVIIRCYMNGATLVQHTMDLHTWTTVLHVHDKSPIATRFTSHRQITSYQRDADDYRVGQWWERSWANKVCRVVERPVKVMQLLLMCTCIHTNTFFVYEHIHVRTHSSFTNTFFI